jgi:hypothetical protein
MISRLKLFDYLLAVIVINMPTNAYAQGPNASLDWSIATSKIAYYPGEPVLLTLTIKNIGQQEEKIDFGADGIEAFSMEIHDSNKIVAKGDKIQRFGVSRIGTLALPSGQIAQKSIVLNQWCSTLLTPGQYHVICHIEYRLGSELQKQPDNRVLKAGPLHPIELGLDINIIKMDISEFKKIILKLNGGVVVTDVKTKENLVNRIIAREMLVFTESPAAVPYQLEILKNPVSTWLKWDAINSLVRSGTLEGTIGLMQIVSENEGSPNRIEDVKRQIIDAVYRLRETGKPDIVKATDEFARKHERPVLGKPAD